MSTIVAMMFFGDVSLHAGELELAGAVTGDEMGRGDLLPGRCLRAAQLDRMRAAGVEIATVRG